MIKRTRVVTTAAVQALWFYFLLMAAWAIPTRTLALALGLEGPGAVLACAAVGIALAAAIFMLRHRAEQWRAAFSARRVLPGWGWALIVGFLLRVGWILAFPATPTSDGATYIQLAQNLLTTGAYGSEGARAYWPPGYVFLLLPLVASGVSMALALCVLNLSIYLALACLVPWQTRRWFGDSSASSAAWLLALWPSLIAFGGLPEKEMPAMLLVVGIVVLLAGQRRLWQLMLAGILLGGLVLLQPSFQLWPAALLVVLFLRGRPIAQVVGHTLLVAVVALLVIAPWTLRNYRVFDQFVLVSSNGGSNLYRANNPLANGGYSEKSEISLDKLSELEADRQGKMLTKRWWAEHPADAFELGLHKQRLFLGEDGVGLYGTFRSNRDRISPTAYLGLKVLNQGYWVLLLALIAYATLAKSRPLRVGGPAGLAVMTVLYLFVLHSVFESNAKYHVPLYGLLAILAAAAFAQRGATEDVA